MNITVYSFLLAVLWCNIFVLILALLRQHTKSLMYFGLLPLVFLIVTTVIRLCFSIEFPFTRVIQSTKVFPAIQSFLMQRCFSLGSFQVRILTLLLAGWFLVSALRIGHFWIAWARQMKIISAYPQNSDEKTKEILERIVKESGSKTTVRIVTAQNNLVPYVIGFCKPVIVMPDMDYSEEDLLNIFRHEWQHFLNHDQWSKMLVYMICCIMWWNPFVYLLKNQLDKTLELQCDFAILAGLSEEKRDSYYETILRIYKTLSEKRSKTALMPSYASSLFVVSAGSGIKQRFVLGLNYSAMKQRGKATAILLCCAIVALFAASYLFVLQPAYAPPEATGNEPPSFTAFNDSSFILDNGDGTYTLYIDGVGHGAVKDPSGEAFRDIPIRKK